MDSNMMISSSVLKVPNGKLLRAEVEHDGNRIKKVKITGDFFLHPEEVIIRIEGVFEHCALPLDEKRCVEMLARVLEGAQLIGAAPEDIVMVVRQACGE
ncbi:MAG: hypothetical protein ABIA93_07360 [Candidatus Woesearchaeota archaeon]